MPKISICIPTTELKYSNGDIMGVKFLNHLFKTIQQQNFHDYEVIVSDQSSSDIIEEECSIWKNINIRYYKNENDYGSAARNLNFAIAKANGDIIKPIFQDDFFYNENALSYIVENFKDSGWGALGTYHCYEGDIQTLVNPISPHWVNEIQILSGINTISGPSVIFFLNDDNYFDEDLCWLNDCELYYRLYMKYGTPICLPEKMINQRMRSESVSNTLSLDLQNEEKEYVLAKHSISQGSKRIEDYPNIYNRIKNL